MKQISEQQIALIEKALVDVNVPVQVFIGIQNLFKGLPEVKIESVVKELNGK